MIALMVYISIYAPFEIAFFSSDIGSSSAEMNDIVGLIVDGFFFLDIIINFLSSYEIENGKE